MGHPYFRSARNSRFLSGMTDRTTRTTTKAKEETDSPEGNDRKKSKDNRKDSSRSFALLRMTTDTSGLKHTWAETYFLKKAYGIASCWIDFCGLESRGAWERR
jgi:hypothetical protein